MGLDARKPVSGGWRSTKAQTNSAFPNYGVFQTWRIVFALTNSVDPDEMLHNAAFHQGLHCLPEYPF